MHLTRSVFHWFCHSVSIFCEFVSNYYKISGNFTFKSAQAVIKWKFGAFFSVDSFRLSLSVHSVVISNTDSERCTSKWIKLNTYIVCSNQISKYLFGFHHLNSLVTLLVGWLGLTRRVTSVLVSSRTWKIPSLLF